MNPVPVPAELAAAFPHLRRIVIGSPKGSLIGDGSSPEDAMPVEALVGIDPISGWPMMREYFIPTAEEVADLKAGCPAELVLWVPQMPVHCLNVQPVPIV